MVRKGNRQRGSGVIETAILMAIVSLILMTVAAPLKNSLITKFVQATVSLEAGGGTIHYYSGSGDSCGLGMCENNPPDTTSGGDQRQADE